jgi:hypothetical protein
MSNDMNDMRHIPVSSDSKKKDEDEEKKFKGAFRSRRSWHRPNSQNGGPLAPVLDPVGKGVETVLSPVGIVVSTITKPVTNAVGGITRPVVGPFTGNKEEKMEVLGGKNLDSYEHGKDSMGGREQTGDNPLGMDQSGKWGFREE